MSCKPVGGHKRIVCGHDISSSSIRHCEERQRRSNPASRRFWIASSLSLLAMTFLPLLWLPFLHRASGVAPGGEAAAEMRDRLQAHILRGFGGQRRAQAAGAMKDEFLVLLEDRLGVRTLRIDPEFQHAAGAGEWA